MRAGAESSRTTASVGSLGEQTLFAQRSPYGHPKSEIRSQVCFGRGDLSLWSGRNRAKQSRLGETARGQDGCGLGDWDSGACTAAGGSLSLIPGPSGRRDWGVRVESRAASTRSPTVLLRAISDGASVNDRGPCCCRRSRTMPA